MNQSFVSYANFLENRKVVPENSESDLLLLRNYLDWRRRQDADYEKILRYEVYYEILIEELQKWGANINADCISHAKFIHSDRGRALLFQIIASGIYGKCNKCGSKLVPYGRRNKPMKDDVFIICIICDKHRGHLHIDGAYFGDWINEEVKEILQRIVVKS